MADDFYCICSGCKKRFQYSKAQVKKRKLFNSEITEKACPYCGSKAFTREQDLYELSQMASHHRYGQ